MIPANPFVLASSDPLSTFAADVDTASYDLFRRDAQRGSLPAPEGVRLEDFVNYFRYDYPAPSAGSEIPFSISLAAAPNPFGRDTALFRVGIQGKTAPPRGADEQPANLVFLVDVSGSMDDASKLPLVKVVLSKALNVLGPRDTISIVAYASSTRVVLAPTAVSERRAIEQAIENLAAGGSTAGAAGLDLAYEEAAVGFVPQGINHVFLCTDGDFNVGPSSTPELLKMIEAKRQSGVNLTVLGFGSASINDGMMEAVSNAGNGMYSAITDLDQATQYVTERFVSTMTLIAKDMKIQVEFNPDQVYAYRLLGYEDRALADSQFRVDTVDAGEVGAGHRVTALYEIVLPGRSIPQAQGARAVKQGAAYAGPVSVGSTDLAMVSVRYRSVTGAADASVQEVSSHLSVDQMIQSGAAMPSDFEWASAVATMAEILKRSPYALRGSVSELDRIFSANADSGDPDRAELASLFAAVRDSMAPYAP